MNNFVITGDEHKELARMGMAAENNIYLSPRSSLVSFGAFAEALTQEIFRLDGLEDWNLKQIDRLDKLSHSLNEYPPTVLVALNKLRKIRNLANHEKDRFHPTINMALEADENAFTAWKWFLEVFSQESVPDYQEPKEDSVVKNKELKDKELQVQNQALEIKRLQEQLKQFQEKQPVVEVTEEIRETRRQINQHYAKNHPLTEAETRELIDEQLRKAGWEVDTNKLNNWKNKTMPQKGHNLAISEWVLPNGERADYALFLA